jgi:cell division protein FtsB
MMTRQHKKPTLRRMWMPLITAAFLGYFGFHAFSGAFGIWAMDRLEQDAIQLSGALDGLKAERQALEAKVATMRPANLDADALDVAARTQLNLIRSDEIVIDSPAALQQARE